MGIICHTNDENNRKNNTTQRDNQDKKYRKEKPESPKVSSPEVKIKKVIKNGNKNKSIYSKFAFKEKKYYLICPDCHKCLPKIENIKYVPEKNDFIIEYNCQCNIRSSNNLINFIDTKMPSNYDTIEMKQFLDDLMKEGKTKKDEFKGFELIKSINKTFLKESKLCIDPAQLFYQCVRTFNKCEEKIFSLIKLKNDLLLAGTEKGKIILLNFEIEYQIKEIQIEGSVLCLLEFEEDFILAGTSENDIVLWYINDPNFNYKFNGHNGWVNSLTKCNDKIFASASNDKTIRIWDYKEKSIINTLKSDSSILCLIKLKDGKLCSSEDDRLIKIWDWENGECIYNLIGHKNRVRSICQLEDGTFLSGDDDSKIIIWKNKEIFKTLEGHEKEIRTLCQIDDNHFASGSIDNTIKIWNYKSLKCIQTLESKDEGHNSNVTNIIKLGKNIFASSSSDKTIKLWKNNINN